MYRTANHISLISTLLTSTLNPISSHSTDIDHGSSEIFAAMQPRQTLQHGNLQHSNPSSDAASSSAFTRSTIVRSLSASPKQKKSFIPIARSSLRDSGRKKAAPVPPPTSFPSEHQGRSRVNTSSLSPCGSYPSAPQAQRSPSPSLHIKDRGQGRPPRSQTLEQFVSKENSRKKMEEEQSLQAQASLGSPSLSHRSSPHRRSDSGTRIPKLQQVESLRTSSVDSSKSSSRRSSVNGSSPTPADTSESICKDLKPGERSFILGGTVPETKASRLRRLTIAPTSKASVRDVGLDHTEFDPPNINRRKVRYKFFEPVLPNRHIQPGRSPVFARSTRKPGVPQDASDILDDSISLHSSSSRRGSHDRSSFFKDQDGSERGEQNVSIDKDSLRSLGTPGALPLQHTYFESEVIDNLSNNGSDHGGDERGSKQSIDADNSSLSSLHTSLHEGEMPLSDEQCHTPETNSLESFEGNEKLLEGHSGLGSDDQFVSSDEEQRRPVDNATQTEGSTSPICVASTSEIVTTTEETENHQSNSLSFQRVRIRSLSPTNWTDPQITQPLPAEQRPNSSISTEEYGYSPRSSFRRYNQEYCNTRHPQHFRDPELNQESKDNPSSYSAKVRKRFALREYK